MRKTRYHSNPGTSSNWTGRTPRTTAEAFPRIAGTLKSRPVKSRPGMVDYMAACIVGGLAGIALALAI